MQTDKQSCRETFRSTRRVWVSSSRWLASELFGVLTICATLVLNPGTLQAAISVSGDVTPAYTGSDPWTSYQHIIVADQADGTLSIDSGSTVDHPSYPRRDGYLGYGAGFMGVAVVDGIGSSWSLGNNLYVGHQGQGVLALTNSGTANVFANTWVEHLPGGTGQIYFNNGILNTGGLLAAPSDLLGVGTINTTATVTDSDLIFDAVNGTTQQLVFDDLPGQNITLNIDLGLLQRLQSLGAGYRGVGTLRLADGLNVHTGYGHIGYHAGSDGAVTVSGSLWDARGLYVGSHGTGTLNIENGSTLGSYDAHIGHEVNSSGTINITGSTWDADIYVYVGEMGHGRLIVGGGGSVEANYLFAGTGPGASGHVSIQGPGSNISTGFFTSIGIEGTATLEILDQAVLTTGDLSIGALPGSSGDVTVSGSGSSVLVYDELFVGKQGEGTLAISGGGSVTADDSYIGHGAGATGGAVVDGSGSVWDNQDRLVIGGSSGLQILNGGVVHGAATSLLESTGTPGDVIVDGPGSLLTTSTLNVHGSRTLHISNDGEVQSTYATSIGAGTTAAGTLFLNNGVLRTPTLIASDSDIRGIGDIYTEGVIADRDLVFDATHGLQQQWTINDLPDQNITLHLDATNPSGLGSLGAGYAGVGTLLIADGSYVTSKGGYLGYNTGSAGTATVTGEGSTWHGVGQEFSIGWHGNGSLIIENGGLVRGGSAYLAYQSQGSSGSITVRGHGSTLDLSSSLNIGYRGAGTLSIEDGGLVRTNSGSIGGSYIGSSGSVAVSDVGSLWDMGSLQIGSAGSGELIIQNGAKVEVASQITLGGLGTINLLGGTLKFDHKMFGLPANPRDPLPHTYGTFAFAGGRFETGWLIALNQPLVQNGGTLAVDNIQDRTDIIGDYWLNDGTVEIDFGIAPGLHELITATGDIDISILGTTLDLRALGSMAAGTYTVLESTGGNITGMFENVSAFNLFGVNVTVLNAGTAITVTLDSDLVFADPNLDGFVGIEDLNIVLGNWNQNVTPGDILAGDLNGDGFVGIEDLNAILGSWNLGTPPQTASAAIPEPGAIGVFVLGVICISSSRIGCKR